MLPNTRLGHFLFSFYICLGDLIYFHGFNYYLLLITFQIHIAIPDTYHEVQRHDTWNLACSLNRILQTELSLPPLWMTFSITQYLQHCQFCLLKYGFSSSLVSYLISTQHILLALLFLALNWSPASSPPFQSPPSYSQRKIPLFKRLSSH